MFFNTVLEKHNLQLLDIENTSINTKISSSKKYRLQQ